MNLTIAGEDYDVQYVEDARVIEGEIRKESPQFITYDTETLGLHIKRDHPFLAAICFNYKVCVFPSTKQNMLQLRVWSKMVKRIYAHNTPFDMHALANATGDDLLPYKIENWGDLMCLIRLTVEAKSVRHGGDKLGLKPFSDKYIDKEASRYEKEVKGWLKAKRAQDRKVLKGMLAGVRDEKGIWTLKRFESALNDGTEELTPDVVSVFNDWNKYYPKPTYQDVPIDIMLPYVATDVILTKIGVLKCLPVVVHKKQVEIMNKEFRLLRTVYRMERRGIQVDRDYLLECNVKLDKYIEDLYTKLHLLSGISNLKSGQHERIRQMYSELLGEELASSDKKVLKKLEEQGDEMAPLITRIRRFEKWKSTYIERILDVSEHDGRFYTQFNQFNPVSGRFSGDAQQFPKDPIYTEEGYEYEKEHPDKKVPSEFILYHPRRAFLGRIYYLDYSQVELRVQSHYTIRFGGDTNMCRAYMPFGCRHYRTGELYDYRTVAGRKQWSELQDGSPTDLHWEDSLKKGYSAWVDPDTDSAWVPTDVHTSTTLKALVVMGFDPAQMAKEDIAWWRKKGKTFNFMRNYGGGDAKAAETLDISLDAAKAMNQGYTDSFPVVVTYQNWVVDVMRQQGFFETSSGRRYYLSDWNKHYTVANYGIQGLCADRMKDKMIEIDDYLEQNNLWDTLPMIMTIHDELQFEELADGMRPHISKIKDIMEDLPEILTPIVAEVEYTSTNWSEKKAVVI